jgi:serine/threonine protein kinase
LRQSWTELEALEIFDSHEGHNNIIKFYGNQMIGCRMHLFLEFTPLRDLAQNLSIKYQNRDPEEEEIHEIFRQVLQGLNHMHNDGYAHRDLKFQNILLFGGGSDSGSVDRIVYN